MSKKISQLTKSTFSEVTPDDLILSAGLSVPEDLVNENLSEIDSKGARNINSNDNYKITVNEFCKYFRAKNTYQLKEKYFNFDNVKSSVSNNNVEKKDLESLTFNEFGIVTDLTLKDGTGKVTDTIAGTFLSTPSTKEWQGYFDKTVDSEQSGQVVGGTIGSWLGLFDKSYSSYKKTIINYTQARNDSTGNNLFNVCKHKIIIFWDHGNTKSILACASGQYPALEGPSALPLKYNTKTYLINDLFIPQKDNTFSKSAGDEYKVLLEIDVANSKINKLPLPSYLGNGQETVAVSMTVESFV